MIVEFNVHFTHAFSSDGGKCTEGRVGLLLCDRCSKDTGG
jgi:hypothetical protein